MYSWSWIEFSNSCFSSILTSCSSFSCSIFNFNSELCLRQVAPQCTAPRNFLPAIFVEPREIKSGSANLEQNNLKNKYRKTLKLRKLWTIKTQHKFNFATVNATHPFFDSKWWRKRKMRKLTRIRR